MKIFEKKEYGVLVLGAGGTGGWLASFLSKLSLKEVIMLDGDDVELKNILRQNFTLNDVNKGKAQQIAERYGLKYIHGYLDSTEMLEEIFDEFSTKDIIVVGCLDNNASRKIVHDYLTEGDRDFIYIDAGNAERYGQAFVAIKENGQILEDFKSPLTLEAGLNSFDGDERRPDQISCAEHSESAPQNVTANVTSACVLFNLINIIISGGTLLHNKYNFDTRFNIVSSELVK